MFGSLAVRSLTKIAPSAAHHRTGVGEAALLRHPVADPRSHPRLLAKAPSALVESNTCFETHVATFENLESIPSVKREICR